MKIAVISLTENGRQLSQKISDNQNTNMIFTRYTLKKYSDSDSIAFENLKELVSQIFCEYEALIFISSCGIAVRMIAPHIRSKLIDPAVIVTDEQGKFAVSLLSGHIGGANALTKLIAEKIGAVPVVTTATDVGGKFSPDSFASANNLHICEPDLAKQIAAAIVNGEKIGFKSDFEFVNRPDEFFDNDSAELGICVSADASQNPFRSTLHLIPKNIVIGVGCRRNIDKDVFSDFIINQLSEFHLSVNRISAIHSINLKKAENAVISFAEKYKIPLKFFTAEELMSVEGSFSHSDFVMKTTGADSVCERSAAAGGGKIIVSKQMGRGVTFAAAETRVTIDFERDIL